MHVAGGRRIGAGLLLTHIQGAHTVSPSMQQVLHLQKAVRRRLQAGLDDAAPPGIGCCVANATELTQPVERKKQLALDALAVAKRQAHRVDFKGLFSPKVARAVGEFTGELGVAHIRAFGLRQPQNA